MIAPTTSATICIEVRQSWCETSQAASGAIVIGAMPMPAETSDTARLRWVSNQPVTVAIIGAKIAAQEAPTRRPKMTWNAISELAWLAQQQAQRQHDRPGQHHRQRAEPVRQRSPEHAGEGHGEEADGHRAGDAGHRPSGVLGDRLQEHRQREHAADGDTAEHAAGGDDHPAIVGRGHVGLPSDLSGWKTNGNRPDRHVADKNRENNPMHRSRRRRAPVHRNAANVLTGWTKYSQPASVALKSPFLPASAMHRARCGRDGFAERYERGLLHLAAEIQRVGIAHDLAWVTGRLEIAGR